MGSLQQLVQINDKIASRFSGMITEYVVENQKRFKLVINKREKVHKIMLRIQGLL